MSAWKQIQCRTRVRILLVVIFVLLLAGNYFDWQYFQQEAALARISKSTLRYLLGTLITSSIVPTAILIGIWCRLRGMRGLLLALLAVSVTGGLIAVLALVYDGRDFPTVVLIADLLRLLAWSILTFVPDIRYFLSCYYDDRPE